MVLILKKKKRTRASPLCYQVKKFNLSLDISIHQGGIRSTRVLVRRRCEVEGEEEYIRASQFCFVLLSYKWRSLF